MNTVLEQITLETESCCTCGVVFAMPSRLKTERLANGGNFWCPNGHEQHYTKTRVQRLTEELQQAQHDLRASKCEAIYERNLKEAAQRKLMRVKNGVCPCCSRHFINLQNHIKTKHPSFSTSPKTK